MIDAAESNGFVGHGYIRGMPVVGPLLSSLTGEKLIIEPLGPITVFARFLYCRYRVRNVFLKIVGTYLHHAKSVAVFLAGALW